MPSSGRRASSRPPRKGRRSEAAASEAELAALTDRDLVARCLEGSEDAWRVLLDRYSALILSIARQRGLDPTLVEETFQQVAATLASRLAFIEDPTCLPKWLMTTTRRCAHAIRAKRDREPNVEELREPPTEDDPEGLLASAEMRAHVRLALQDLRERDRELLLDLFVRDLPYADTASRHGLAVGSLGSLRARALARLREALRQRGVE